MSSPEHIQSGDESVGETPEAARARHGDGVMRLYDPSQVWCMARLGVMRDLRRQIEAVIAAGASQADEHRLIALSRKLEAGANDLWLEFVAACTGSQFEHNAMLDVGQPDFIEHDHRTGIVKVMWKGRGNQREHWGILEIMAEKDGTGQPMLLATPFREVDLRVLPKGSQQVHITDRQIAATFTIHEILDTIVRNIKQFAPGMGADQLWQRMLAQAKFFREPLTGILDRLADDNYLEWKKPDLDKATLVDAIRVVAESGATTIAQRTIAMRIVTRYYTDLLNACERDNPQGGESEWVDKAFQELQTVCDKFATDCDGYERTLLAWAKISTQGKRVMRIFRPFPEGVPLLAVVPADASAAPTALPRAAD